MNLSNADFPEIPTTDDRGARLAGWNDIAAYLGKTDRTVKRWGRDRGLPIHRVPGTARTSVYAYTHEVDRWLESARVVDEEVAETSQEPAVPPQPSADGNARILEQASLDRGLLKQGPPGARSSQSLLRRWLLIGLAALLAAVSMDVAVRLRATPLAGKLRSFLSGRADHGGPHLAVTADEQRQADDFYLRGRYEWNQRTPASLHRALDLFTQAIVHNPEEARAYAGLADTYDLLREYSTDADGDVFPRAIAAAKKAVALDDSLAEAHRALAFAEMYGDWNFEGAEGEFRRAIALDPRDPQARRWYANAISIAGRYREAEAQMDRAQELDPASHTTLADKGWMLYNANHAQSGIELLREVERSAPEFGAPHNYLMQVALDLRDYPAFLSEGQLAARSSGDGVLSETVAAAKDGYDRGGSRGLLQALYEKQKFYYAAGKIRAVLLAKTCMLMERRQEALDVMEDAYRHHDFEVLTLLSDPDLIALKGDPRYRELVGKIDYPQGLLVAERLFGGARSGRSWLGEIRCFPRPITPATWTCRRGPRCTKRDMGHPSSRGSMRTKNKRRSFGCVWCKRCAKLISG
jgi:tetratricopeptide (TPR) repeat protein